MTNKGNTTMEPKTLLLLALGALLGTNGLQAVGVTLPSLAQATETRQAADDAQAITHSQAVRISDLLKMLEECQLRRAACLERCGE